MRSTQRLTPAFVTSWLLLAGCGSDGNSTATSGSGGEETTSGEPTPGAPDESCPGQLDPARVYLAVRIGSTSSTTMLVYPVDEPELACAYRAGQPGQHLFIAVDGAVRFLRYGDAGEIVEYPQRWLELRTKGTGGIAGDEWGVPVVHENAAQTVETLGCAIGSMGSFFVRQRYDGDVGFYCADGIGGSWVYDRPGDVTLLEVNETIGHQLVAPLPGDRWLVPSGTTEGIGLRVLQGDAQQIDVVAGDDITRVTPITARATEAGALLVGYVDHADGSTGVELTELVGEQLASVARYEHGAEIDWPFYNDENFDSVVVFRPALGADGTLAAVVEIADPGSVQQVVWMRPDTAPMVLAQLDPFGLADDPDRPDEIIEIIDVLSQ